MQHTSSWTLDQFRACANYTIMRIFMPQFIPIDGKNMPSNNRINPRCFELDSLYTIVGIPGHKSDPDDKERGGSPLSSGISCRRGGRYKPIILTSATGWFSERYSLSSHVGKHGIRCFGICRELEKVPPSLSCETPTSLFDVANMSFSSTTSSIHW
jgi:hypothetical protein